MNQETSLISFLDDIITYGDLAARIDEVSELNRLLYLNDGKSFTARIADKISPGLFKIISSLEQAKQLPTTTSELEDFFLSLRSYLGKVPHVTLTLAFDPPESLVRLIADWFGKNLAAKTVLEIRVREEIIAGMIIEYNGKYKDYSKMGQLGEALRQVLSTNI